MEVDAIAIYLYDMTHHIEHLINPSESQSLNAQEKNLFNSHVVYSNDFRQSINVTLMFLQTLLTKVSQAEVKRIVIIVISQVNLMMSLLNDILDMKLIEHDQFTPKLSTFSTEHTFKFILNLLEPQASIQNSELTFSAKPLSSSEANDDQLLNNAADSPRKKLPS